MIIKHLLKLIMFYFAKQNYCLSSGTSRNEIDMLLYLKIEIREKPIFISAS